MTRVLRLPLGSGDHGTMQTLAVMADLIRSGPRSPIVMQAARALAVGVGQRAWAISILYFVRRAFKYVDDPVTDEHVSDAEYMLREYDRTAQVRGDCDDAAVLAGSLAHAIGIPVYLTVLAFENGAPYSHVYATLCPDNGSSIDVDVTRPIGPVRAPVARSMTVEV